MSCPPSGEPTRRAGAHVHAAILLAIIVAEPALPPPSDEPCPPLPPGGGCFDIWDAGSGIIVAIRFFHQDLIELLGIADLPALLVGGGAMDLLALPERREISRTESYVVAWVWCLAGTCQWWLCGILIERARRARQDRV
jgi:hypothetical protein